MNLDYTDRDFDSIRARLFNTIGSVFPTWTESAVANFGNILIDSFAFVGDVLTKYQDNQARESRWSTATQRKNILAMIKLIPFIPTGATASRVDVTVTVVGGPVANDITIPDGTIVRTTSVGQPVRFETIGPYVIPAGVDVVPGITAENSEGAEETYVSRGTANQEIELTATPYLDDSALVTAGNGFFTQVDDFLDSTSTDLHYTVTVDQTGRARLRFGNGVNGAIPSGTITITYRTGGGVAGVVDAGTVTVIEGTFTDALGNLVSLTVTNPNKSTEAVDRPSVGLLKERAPLAARTLTRTVSRDDYQNNALRLTEVSRALCLTSDNDRGIRENAGILFIIPRGGGVPTDTLKDSVLRQCTVVFPNTITFNLAVSDPVYHRVDVSTTVHFVRGQSPTVVKARIVENLTAYFAPELPDGTINPNVKFGFEYAQGIADDESSMPWSDIFNAVRDTQGVRKIDDGPGGLLLNGESSDVELLLREFPALGTITVIDAATGTAV